MPSHSNRRRALDPAALLLSLAGLLISQSAWSNQPRTYSYQKATTGVGPGSGSSFS